MEDFRLKECLDALGKEAQAIEKNEEKRVIIKQLIDKFPPTSWGRIDWNEVDKKQLLEAENAIVPELKKANKKLSDDIYILWNDGSLPIVKSNLKKILENLYDITTVSFDTWLYCPSEGWVVEFHHDGEITLGFE